MRYHYVALTDRRLIFMNASFWTARPKGLAWSDPRDSITISDLIVGPLLAPGAAGDPDPSAPPAPPPPPTAPQPPPPPSEG